jgi:hypothetical protein
MLCLRPGYMPCLLPVCCWLPSLLPKTLFAFHHVAFPTLRGAVACSHTLLVARCVLKSTQSGGWRSCGLRAKLMELVGQLAVLTDVVQGSRAFAMVLFAESSPLRYARSRVQAWPPMCQVATRKTRACEIALKWA